MGIILDGTYSALGRLYTFFNSPDSIPTVSHIQRIARSVADKSLSADDGLAEMADLLPKDLGTAVKKLGSKNPLTAFLIVLAVISSMSVVGTNVVNIYRALSPNAPVPPTVIVNNNPTIINSATPGQRSKGGVLKSISREQSRRLRQMRAKQEKGAKPTNNEAEGECGPRIEAGH